MTDINITKKDYWEDVREAAKEYLNPDDKRTMVQLTRDYIIVYWDLQRELEKLSRQSKVILNLKN